MRCLAAIDSPGAAFDGTLRIPAGTFDIGSDKHYSEEAPVPRVTVDEFPIDRTPVTNRQFKAFMRATGQPPGGGDMKLSIAVSALLITGFMAASTEEAGAVVYCQYVSYPAGCIVRPGVVLRPRPVARAVVTPGVGAVGVGVRRGTPMNRGGPVNRVGRR